MFIVNVNKTFNLLWQSIQLFIDNVTKKKVYIVRQNTCKELQRLVAPQQLQLKYGGTSEDRHGPHWWPPRMPEGGFEAE